MKGTMDFGDNFALGRLLVPSYETWRGREREKEQSRDLKCKSQLEMMSSRPKGGSGNGEDRG